MLEDDGRGRQKVEVEQVAAWKLLMFSGSFSTRLYVFQDKRRGVVSHILGHEAATYQFAFLLIECLCDTDLQEMMT